LYLTFKIEDTLIQNQNLRQESLWVTVKNISGRALNDLEVDMTLFSDTAQSDLKKVFVRTLSYSSFALDATMEPVNVFSRNTNPTNLLQVSKSYWDIQPRSIQGNYTGQMVFFASNATIVFDSIQTAGSIGADYNLNLSIIDQVNVVVDGTTLRLMTMNGLISSAGEFWGECTTDSTTTFLLRASNVPATTSNDQLRIGFKFPTPIGTALIDSVACLLTKN
jgi:hypothetical protein